MVWSLLQAECLLKEIELGKINADRLGYGNIEVLEKKILWAEEMHQEYEELKERVTRLEAENLAEVNKRINQQQDARRDAAKQAEFFQKEAISQLERQKLEYEEKLNTESAARKLLEKKLSDLEASKKALNAVNESLRKEQSTLKKESEDLCRKLKDEITKLEKQKEAMQETYQKEVLEQIDKINKKHEKEIMKLELEHKLELDRLKLKVIKDFAGGNK